MKPTYEELEQKLEESRREFRAADATIHNLELKVAAVVAESGQMLRLLTDISENHDEYLNADEYMYAGIPLDYVSEINMYVSRDVNAENPFKETDAYLAEVRTSGIPDGYKLVPEQMYLDAGDIELICSQCGNGDKKYGEFNDGILWVGELSNSAGVIKYGLNVADANYPEEGSITVFEFDEPPFAAQLRQGAAL